MSTPAPSVVDIGKPVTKLPLAARKNIRDKWESQRPKYEQKISEITGVPWSCPVDYGLVWHLCTDDSAYPHNSPGGCIDEYIRSFVSHLETYKSKNGQMAIDELNKVAHSHAVILAPATDPDIKRWGTEIQSDGIFRIVFTQDNIGVNTSNAAEDIIGTVQKAAKAGGATSVLNLTARSSIQNKWDAKVNELTEDFKKILATPVFTLSPNFETNAQALADFDKANPGKLRGDELDRIGEWTEQYFSGAKGQLKRFKFDSDDMLQEGFKEVIDKNELSLRVVPALKKGPNAYNEAVVEGGVLVMQTTAPTFLSNVDDVLQYVEGLL